MRRSSPVDAPRGRVVGALQRLGFRVRHATIKGSTLRAICTQVGIERAEFLGAYYRERR